MAATFRRFTGGNPLVAIILLSVVAFLVGPSILPRLITVVFPNGAESIPCAWLRTADSRAEHQSLIGRVATSPLSLKVRSSNLPQASGGVLVITLTLTNNSIGTVGIYFNPAQIRYGDDGITPGLGLVFNSRGSQPFGAAQSNTPFSEDDLRLLGPRQSCVHQIEFPYNQYPDPTIATGNATVKAYYRNTVRGVALPVSGTVATPIFVDQGLWLGVVESESIRIAFPNA